MDMKRLKIIVLLFILAASLTVIIFAANNHLVIKTYTITTDKVESAIRIAFISDLHSRSYGNEEKELLDAISGQSPDIVLFGGDIVDKDASFNKALKFTEAVSSAYPCFFVTGNNEFSTGKVSVIKGILKYYSVTNLEGDCIPIKVNDQPINICGVDDCKIGRRALVSQLENTTFTRDPSLYTILLAHHPEHIDLYAEYDFDLVLSGHTHGGLFRIPKILNGFYAPNQGFFPKYAGGQYQYGKTELIVNRGIAKESSYIPRVFNPPELVLVDILPE